MYLRLLGDILARSTPSERPFKTDLFEQNVRLLLSNYDLNQDQPQNLTGEEFLTVLYVSPAGWKISSQRQRWESNSLSIPTRRERGRCMSTSTAPCSETSRKNAPSLWQSSEILRLVWDIVSGVEICHVHGHEIQVKSNVSRCIWEPGTKHSDISQNKQNKSSEALKYPTIL